MCLDESLPAELQMDRTNRVIMRARNLVRFLDNFIKIPWNNTYRVIKYDGPEFRR